MKNVLKHILVWSLLLLARGLMWTKEFTYEPQPAPRKRGQDVG